MGPREGVLHLPRERNRPPSLHRREPEPIKRTALVTARYHGGEPWGDGDNRAFPVFGPAAGEEHPGVMSHLAEVLDDEEQCARLAVATDQDFVRKTLAAPPE